MSLNCKQVFLIDDSASMRQYWDEVQMLFKVLASITKGLSGEQLELHLPTAGVTYRSRDITPLQNKIREIQLDPLCGSRPDRTLPEILKRYSEKMHKDPQQADRKPLRVDERAIKRPMNLYVFTDGIWGPESDIGASIRTLSQNLRKAGMTRDQVGIQFIQFGPATTSMENVKHWEVAWDRTL